MADEDAGTPQDGEESQTSSGHRDKDAPRAEFRMELRDDLPGDRAVIGVEQEGEFMWLASRKHVTEQAVDEFMDQLQRIVHNGWWVQNWPGR
jgi:hypothetical protein